MRVAGVANNLPTERADGVYSIDPSLFPKGIINPSRSFGFKGFVVVDLLNHTAHNLAVMCWMIASAATTAVIQKCSRAFCYPDCFDVSHPLAKALKNL